MVARLSVIFLEAADQGVVSTIRELSYCREFDAIRDDPLEVIRVLIEEADEHKIQITPNPRSIDDWDYPIALRRISARGLSQIGSKIAELVASNELPTVEMKSTLWTDVNRQKYNPNATADELRSLIVANSAMKTICGFLNKGGGDLIIGIDDSGSVIGLESDFIGCCSNNPSLDGWLQEFRSTIFKFFHEPEEVLLHTHTEVGLLDDLHCAWIRVQPRRKLSFCKCKEAKNYNIYDRNGTSTEIVYIQNIENYITRRLVYLNEKAVNGDF